MCAVPAEAAGSPGTDFRTVGYHESAGNQILCWSSKDSQAVSSLSQQTLVLRQILMQPRLTRN